MQTLNACPSSDSCNSKAHDCIPSPQGCLRCDSIPAGDIPSNTSAILFGSRDDDSAAALEKALTLSGFDSTPFGPLRMVCNVRDRLTELGNSLQRQLSLYTQCCIQAAYVPVAMASVSQALSAMVFAAPLSDVLAHLECEWVRTALSENWLFSVFHPIIQPGTGEVFAYEALLRARDPRDSKVIGAGPIIDACDKLNLLHQLDQRARRCAIGAAAAHLPASAKVFINFLPNTIYDPEICLRTTMAAAAQHHVAMDRLVFEVVETEQIPDMDNLCRILNYYRDRGVGTAIDDMGAGYAALNYIAALQPDYVKLDREFVLKAHSNDSGRRAMDEMITASHASNSKVIAEGIETPEQMQMCIDAGVDLLQGFLFSRPACPPQAVSIPLGKRAAA